MLSTFSVITWKEWIKCVRIIFLLLIRNSFKHQLTRHMLNWLITSLFSRSTFMNYLVIPHVVNGIILHSTLRNQRKLSKIVSPIKFQVFTYHGQILKKLFYCKILWKMKWDQGHDLERKKQDRIKQTRFLRNLVFVIGGWGRVVQTMRIFFYHNVRKLRSYNLCILKIWQEFLREDQLMAVACHFDKTRFTAAIFSISWYS